jgi:DNA invertase Pin-like site-specific DNA recombinase
MFSLQMPGAVAQLERALIAEHTKARLRAARSRGRVGGNPGQRAGDLERDTQGQHLLARAERLGLGGAPPAQVVRRVWRQRCLFRRNFHTSKGRGPREVFEPSLALSRQYLPGATDDSWHTDDSCPIVARQSDVVM